MPHDPKPAEDPDDDPDAEPGPVRPRRKRLLRRLGQRLRRRRSVLVTASTPMNLVVLRPMLEALARDSRIDLFLTGKYHGNRDIRPLLSHTPDAQRFTLLTEPEAKRLPADVYLSADGTRYGKNSHSRVLTFHGVSFKGRSIGQRAGWFHRVFLTGPYQRRRFVDLGIFAADDPRLIDIGMPKLDRLVNGIDAREVRRRHGIADDETCVLYAPTWGDDSSLATLGEPLIAALARHARVLIKLHDNHYDPLRSRIDWRARMRDWDFPGAVLYQDADVVPALAAADILVSDASSVNQEFTLLDRPMILVEVPSLYQGDRYRSTVDLDTWGLRGGIAIREPGEIDHAMKRALDDPAELSPVRRAIAADLFYHPGDATRHAVAELYAQLNLDPAAV